MLEPIPFSRRSHPLLAVIASVLIGISATSISTGASAGDSSVREIQRLLWSLDYGADHLDGVMSASNRSSLKKFLSERGKASLTENDAIIHELREAFNERRAKVINSNNVVVDRNRLLSANDTGERMELSSQGDLAFTGTCPIFRVRISDNAPLKPFENCIKFSSFAVSRSLGAIVSMGKWNNNTNGVLVLDESSGLRIDFIEVPGAAYFLSKTGVSHDGKEMVIVAADVMKGGGIWKVNLETRDVKKISQFPKNLAEGVRFSPDGRFFSASWTIISGSGKKKKFLNKIGIWDNQTNRKLHEMPGKEIIFSEDGSRIAVVDDKNSSIIEIRETLTNRTIAKKEFESADPSFSFDNSAIAFNLDNTGILYVTAYGKASTLRAWDFQSGDVKEVFKLGSEADRALIQVAQRKLTTVEGADIGTYALDGSSQKSRGHVKSLEAKGGAISPNGRTLVAFTADSLTSTNLESGQVIKMPAFGLTDISAVTFLSDSESLIVGTESGSVLAIKDGKRRDVVELTDEIKVLVSARQGTNVAVQSGKKIIVLDASTGRVIVRDRCGTCFQVASSNLAFVDDDRRLLFNESPEQGYRLIALDIASGRRVLSHPLKSNVKRSGNRVTWMWAWASYIAQNKANPDVYWIGAKSSGSDILYEYSYGRLSPKRGSPESAMGFLPAGSAIGDSFDNGDLVVIVGQYQPKTASYISDTFSSSHLVLKDEPLLLKALSGGRFVTLDKSGEVRIYSRISYNPLVRTILYDGDDWLSRTDQGFFDGTRTAAGNLYLAQGSSRSISLDSMFNALYRPDLVAEAIQGDPSGKVRAAAAQLDLDKVMASGAAPKVTITSPASGSSSATDEVVIEASIVDQGGGVGKVEWRINGVTLGLESRGLDRLDAASPGGSASGKTETVKRTLALEPGDNRIEVLAYNAKGLIASESAQVIVKWDGAKTATPPKLYVLAVGVNDYYDSRLRLAYAVPDAKALAEGFQKAGKGLYASVAVRTVLDSDVTLANLDKVFTEISRKVRPRDVFVFFLAGHGKTKNGRYYFLPRDFRYEDENSIEKAGMGQDKFQAWFASIAARKSLLLYDTCESGSLTGANARGSDVDERLGALNRMARATGRTFLTATTDDAPALEGYRGHGVFTYALLDALDHADVNKNSLIEISELADYIDQKVPDYSYEAFKLRQIPQRSIVGNNFALINKTDALTITSAVKDGGDNFSTTPTHVVVSPATLYEGATESGKNLGQLPIGTAVVLVKSEKGWALIARHGKAIGYVVQDRLARIQ